MKHGHVTGNKKERRGAQDWYRAIQDDHIRRIEAEWHVKQAAQLERFPDGQRGLCATEQGVAS